MKITKAQLKQIIKEELGNAMMDEPPYEPLSYRGYTISHSPGRRHQRQARRNLEDKGIYKIDKNVDRLRDYLDFQQAYVDAGGGRPVSDQMADLENTPGPVQVRSPLDVSPLELEEGFMDKVTGMLGSKKEELPMSDKIAAVRRMFLDVGDDLDENDKLNNAMEALDALKLKDEVGEDGSIGKKLWDASSNLYQAFNDLNKLLREAEIMALRSEYKEEA